MKEEYLNSILPDIVPPAAPSDPLPDYSSETPSGVNPILPTPYSSESRNSRNKLEMSFGDIHIEFGPSASNELILSISRFKELHVGLSKRCLLCKKSCSDLRLPGNKAGRPSTRIPEGLFRCGGYRWISSLPHFGKPTEKTSNRRLLGSCKT